MIYLKQKEIHKTMKMILYFSYHQIKIQKGLIIGYGESKYLFTLGDLGKTGEQIEKI